MSNPTSNTTKSNDSFGTGLEGSALVYRGMLVAQCTCAFAGVYYGEWVAGILGSVFVGGVVAIAIGLVTVSHKAQ